ncbi:hypothetical protein [Streptomyces hesseae]|uniref:Uncharacterized protein n=1 Tax=Streptomyces hesseae TaxID=3075519 RepID=A0ABU2SPQ1_9ACTN|nr:hypothetical protein [Streptomyces sp. DSM 40473]MDT0450962.1 hypothetical protein [Streptomyces sp. DSM 40473]
MNQLENAPVTGRTDGAPGPSPLPDLARTGLRALRASRDPALAAAVEGVLRCTGRLAEAWHSGGEGSEGGVTGARPGR